MMAQIGQLVRALARHAGDLLPIVMVVAFFQALVVGAPMPQVGDRLVGLVLVLFGLTLFVRGLAMSLFPLGDSLANALARRGSLPLLLVFAFALGFGSTAAEPALIAVTDQAAMAAAGAGLVADDPQAMTRYAAILRYAAAAAVGVAVTLGALRILFGWSMAWLVLGGYAIAALIAVASDAPLSSVAFDSGAAATSAINIPLITALGVGLASVLRGRNPLVDGFGIVALSSLMPTLTILIGGIVVGGAPG
jgi:hypothetical protein